MRKKKEKLLFTGQYVEWKGNGVYFWDTKGLPYQYAYRKVISMGHVERLLYRNKQLVYLRKSMLKTIKY